MNDMIFEWLFLAILMSAISLSAWFRIKAHQQDKTSNQRTKGSLIFSITRTCFMLIMIGMIYSLIVKPPFISFSILNLSTNVRAIGGILGILNLVFIFWILRSLGKNITPTGETRDDHELITHGPYHFVRHPLYSSAILFLLMIVLLTNSWLILILFPLLIIFLPKRVGKEEKALINKFGDNYRNYMKRTKRFIPYIY